MGGYYNLQTAPLPGRFDLEHLKAIHRYIFQDVYGWAGQLRTVNISKGTSTFGFYQYIESHLQQTLSDLPRENYLQGLAQQAFVARAAHYLAEINAAHPFREGNGRTQREFIRELALKAGFRLNWNGMSREELYTASEDSMLGKLDGLIALMLAITEPL
jgi:cell filamentation protein, protein adenylyltransferase